MSRLAFREFPRAELVERGMSFRNFMLCERNLRVCVCGFGVGALEFLGENGPFAWANSSRRPRLKPPKKLWRNCLKYAPSNKT